MVLKWTSHDNIEYHINDFLFYAYLDMPKFAKIQHIVIKNEKIIFFLIPFETLKYSSHYMAFNIKEINNYVHKSIYLSAIKNKFPLSKYDLSNNEMIISLKYPLVVS